MAARKKSKTPAQVAEAMQSLRSGSRPKAADLRACEQAVAKSEEKNMAAAKKKKKKSSAKKASPKKAAPKKAAPKKAAPKKAATKKAARKSPARRASRAAKATAAVAPAAKKRKSRKKASTVRLTKKGLRAKKKTLAALGYVRLTGKKKKLLAMYEQSVAEGKRAKAAAKKAKSPAAKAAKKEQAKEAVARAADIKKELKSEGVDVPAGTADTHAYLEEHYNRSGGAYMSNPRRRRKSRSMKSKKKSSRSRRKHTPSHAYASTPVKRRRRRHSSSRRSSSLARMHNPTFTAMQTAAAVVTTGVTYTLVDLLDRFIATRSVGAITGKIEGRDAVGPFYGPEAAAKIAQKPDAIRLGTQLGISVVGFLGAYYVKNDTAKAILGGIGTGAGVHWVFQLLNSYAMPMIFKAVKNDAKDATLGARLYPAEQEGSQKVITTLNNNNDKSLAKGDESKAGALSMAFPWVTSAEAGAEVEKSAMLVRRGAYQVRSRPAPMPISQTRKPATPMFVASPPASRPALFPARVAPKFVNAASRVPALAAEPQAGVGGCGCNKRGGGCGPGCNCPGCQAVYGVSQSVMSAQAEPVARPAVVSEPVARAAASGAPRFFDAAKSVWYTADGREVSAAKAPVAKAAQPAADGAPRWFDATANVWYTADGRVASAPGNVGIPHQMLRESQIAMQQSTSLPRTALDVPESFNPMANLEHVQAIANAYTGNENGPSTPMNQEEIARSVIEEGVDDMDNLKIMGAMAARRTYMAQKAAGLSGTEIAASSAVLSFDDLY